jgi:hypothetical protein
MLKEYLNVLTLVLLLLFGTFMGSLAQEGVAGIPGEYLYMGVGSRALGMGKAYTALATDASAIYWNPAALAEQDPYQVYFMHTNLFFDTNFDYLGFTAPTKNFGSFGLALMALNSGNFDQRNELNQELGSFNILDLAILTSWSTKVFKGIYGGINYKFITQRMLDYSGIGHGLDLAMKTKIMNNIDLGVSVVNILNPKIKMAVESQSFPTQLRLGMATHLFNQKLILSSDLAKVMGWGSTYLNVGAEFKFLNNIALRAGITNGKLTFGTGFTINTAGIDYSHHAVSELGNSHRFAVKYAFGGFGINAKAFPQIFSPAGDQNISRIKLNANCRSEISDWNFKILDNNGNIIREYTEKGELPPEIIWDGRKNDGALADDGAFDYLFEIQTNNGKKMSSKGFLVSIDMQGPEGSLSLGKSN